MKPPYSGNGCLKGLSSVRRPVQCHIYKVCVSTLYDVGTTTKSPNDAFPRTYPRRKGTHGRTLIRQEHSPSDATPCPKRKETFRYTAAKSPELASSLLVTPGRKSRTRRSQCQRALIQLKNGRQLAAASHNLHRLLAVCQRLAALPGD